MRTLAPKFDILFDRNRKKRIGARSFAEWFNKSQVIPTILLNNEGRSQNWYGMLLYVWIWLQTSSKLIELTTQWESSEIKKGVI